MPKPNDERWRINVDLGPKVQFLLDQLVKRLEEKAAGYLKVNRSTVVRAAITHLAKAELPDEDFIVASGIPYTAQGMQEFDNTNGK